MGDNALEAAIIVTNIFAELHIPYVVGGSIASSTFGIFRLTMDADIVAELSLENVDSFLAKLGDRFYVDESAVRSAIINKSSFNLIHNTLFMKVDVFVSRNRPFDKQQLSRSITKNLIDPDGFIKIASAEDTILAKLDWYRMGGEVSEKQWTDIQGVLGTQNTDLDFAYLRHWAIQLNVQDLLKKALKEAKLA